MKQTQIDQLCIDTLRMLSIDAVQKAESGHPGTPLDAAPVAYCLWQRFLRYDLTDPEWPNRARHGMEAIRDEGQAQQWADLSGVSDMSEEQMRRCAEIYIRSRVTMICCGMGVLPVVSSFVIATGWFGLDRIVFHLYNDASETPCLRARLLTFASTSCTRRQRCSTLLKPLSRHQSLLQKARSLGWSKNSVAGHRTGRRN